MQDYYAVFRDAVTKSFPLSVSVEHGAQLLAGLEAAKQSADEGRTITI